MCFGNSESPGFDPTLRLDLNRFARPEGRTRLSGIYRSRSPSPITFPRQLPATVLALVRLPTSPNSSIEHPDIPPELVREHTGAPSINEAHSNQIAKEQTNAHKTQFPSGPVSPVRCEEKITNRFRKRQGLEGKKVSAQTKWPIPDHRDLCRKAFPKNQIRHDQRAKNLLTGVN